MLNHLRLITVIALLLIGTGRAAAQGKSSCADHAISASAIRTTSDIRAFVQCAYEYVQEVGTAEARRAFNEDERWRHGPFYVFVDGIAESSEDSVAYVYPPDMSREGLAWGRLADDFGDDLLGEFNRVLTLAGSGWTYYSSSNPATGRDEPKASYVMEIDWNGNPAAIGAGIYLRDVPGACNSDDVNAAVLDADPSDERLREFVRCAALKVESEGYFAMGELEDSSRWKHGSTYAFVIDMMGNQVLSGRGLGVNGIQLHEWGNRRMPTEEFGGRDVISVGDKFGEAFIYYRTLNPTSGRIEGKVGLLKRVVAQGVPLLVGAGYYVSPGEPSQETSCLDNNVAASAVRTERDIQAFVECAAEYVMEHGPAEARRAFNEDERWRHGPYYVFVDEITEDWAQSIVHVFPPRPSQEGHPWGSLVDNFGTDFYFELNRVMSIVDAGWLHYSFTNFTTGRDEPKSSYIKRVAWNGGAAAVGAGIYRRDLPGSCNSEEVNASDVEADAVTVGLGVGPTEENLEVLVRCAAMTVESNGLFAAPVLEGDPRWNSGSVYVFGIDPATSRREFSGYEGRGTLIANQRELFLELLFAGRDLLGVAEMFGEAYWYYYWPNPANGNIEIKVAYLKRVLAHGVPLLVGSGVYTAGAAPPGTE